MGRVALTMLTIRLSLDCVIFRLIPDPLRVAVQVVERIGLGDIRSGVTAMTTASTDIASGNADLSRRTESTAANLEETAASMDEVTPSADQGYVAAGQPRELVASAAKTARRSGVAITHVIGTMQAINGSSQLDRLTRQNAAPVEQSAAAAESVRDQARRLANRMAVFKLA